MSQKKKKTVKKAIKKVAKKQPVIKTEVDNLLKSANASEGDGQLKTRTFVSTTFDDIDLPKPLPVRKKGFHIVGETNDIDLNEQVIKKFEEDELEKPISEAKEEFRRMKVSRIGTAVLDEVEHNKPSIPTNRELVNNANELFEELASRAGQITKEYWMAKQKLVLMNKFMEEFYSGKKFTELEHVEKPGDFKDQLQKAVDLIDGEDSDYKKMILANGRPDKYKL